MSGGTTSTNSTIRCPNPVFKSPREVLEYLERVEASWLNSQAKGISDAIDAPSAFTDCGYQNLPETADHVLDNGYKLVADPNGNTVAKKAADVMNKRLLTLLVEASKDHALMNGWIKSAPFVRYTTFRAYIHSRYGGAAKVSKSNVDKVKAQIVSDPRYLSQLINVDTKLKVSDGSQTADFFAKIQASCHEYTKLTSNVHDVAVIFVLVTVRLKDIPSNAKSGRRYSDEDWTKIDAAKGDIFQLEHVITELDCDKEAEDDVEANEEVFEGVAGGGSLAYMGHGKTYGKTSSVHDRIGDRDAKSVRFKANQLKPGPSKEKSTTPCPFNSRCRFEAGECFYQHGNTPGRLAVEEKVQQETRSSFAKHAKHGKVYICREDAHGHKRMYEQEDEGGGSGTDTTSKKTKKKARSGKVKAAGGSAKGWSIVNGSMMAFMTIACLFGKVADASTYNNLVPDPTRKQTFENACSIEPEVAATLKTNRGIVSFARDTGCSTSGCCNDGNKFFDLKLTKKMNPIKTAGGQLLKVEGIGSIKLQVQTTHGMKIVIVRNVFFVPGLKFNVFSDQSFVDDGFQFVSDKKGSFAHTPDRKTKIKLEMRDGLQIWQGRIVRRQDCQDRNEKGFDITAINDTDTAKLRYECINIQKGTTDVDDTTVPKLIKALNNAGDSPRQRNPIRKALASLNVYTVNEPSTDKILAAHAALGHPSPERLCKFLAQTMSAADIRKQFGEIAAIWCTSCELAKVTRAPKTGKPMERSKLFGQKTIYDVLGPYPDGRGTGYRYAVVLQDDATNHVTVRGTKNLENIDRVLDDHFAWIETVQHKSVAPNEKHLYQGHVHILPPKETRAAHSDSASYFTSAKSKEVYKSRRVIHTQSSPYSQNQNKVERTIRTLKSSANAMLLAADGINGKGLDISYWFFALARAAEVYNIVPTRTNAAFLSPQQCVTGKAPTLRNQVPFGTPVVALRMHKRLKTDPAKGELGIWLGYNTNNHSHIIHCPRTAGRSAFRHTRHLRLPKMLLNKDLLNGKVPFDSEEKYVPFPSDDFGRDTGGAAATTTTTVRETGGAAATTNTSALEEMEVDESDPLPTSQDECEEDEVFVGFISGTDHGQHVSFANVTPADVDTKNHWQVEVIVPKQAQESQMPWTNETDPSDEEILDNLHEYIDTNMNDDVYDGQFGYNNCYAIGKTYYNINQAMKSRHGDLFKESNESEIRQLIERGVVTPKPIDDPEVQALIKKSGLTPSVKFHQLKYREDGTVKAKSRWCMADKEGIAAGDSPTACATPAWCTIRLLTADCARVGSTLYSCDIPNAFDVGNEIATKVMMRAAPGEREYDSRGVEIVYECLNIYGRTDACRKYQNIFHRDISDMGGQRSLNDPCLYKFPATEHRGKILLIAWIDDLIVSTACPKARKWIEAQLKKKYERLETDDIKFRKSEHLLGMDVKQDHKGIHLSQAKLVDQLLEHYKMTECNGRRTPVPTGTKVSKSDCPSEPFDCDYRHGVAVILYLSTVTRPDLCYAASQLGRVQSAPGKQHMKVLQDVLRYLKQTRDHGLLYKRGNRQSRDEMLDSFADASWCDNGAYTIAEQVNYAELPKDNGKSSGGHVVRYNGTPIEFKSKVINTVCLSTAESELKAAAECAKAILHIRRLVEEITDNALTSPTTIYEDASAVLSQCEKTNYTIKSRVRHIGVAFWFLREQVQNGLVLLKKIDTKDQLADLMTKFLGKILHEQLKERLMTPA